MHSTMPNHLGHAIRLRRRSALGRSRSLYVGKDLSAAELRQAGRVRGLAEEIALVRARRVERPAAGMARTRATRSDLELAVWRARVEEQLASIREDIADLRSRLGALFVVVAAAALGQVVMRLLTGK